MSISISETDDIDKTYNQMGFDGYLLKPFSLEDLSALTARYSKLAAVKQLQKSGNDNPTILRFV